jgi:hypothetical protein
MKLLPVPASPVDLNESVLTQNESALGIAFPDDFVEYSRVFGSGVVDFGPYDVSIYSAFRPTYLEFCKKFHDINYEHREACETFDVPLGLFPEKGGLLPFGIRDDLDFTWKTDGEPNDWKVVLIWRYEDKGYKVYDVGFTEFLVRSLRLELHIPGFTSDWNPATDVSFQPGVHGP